MAGRCASCAESPACPGAGGGDAEGNRRHPELWKSGHYLAGDAGNVGSYATRAAEKMRRYKVAADNLFVFMHTNTFNNDPFYSNGALARFPAAANDSGEVVALAVRLDEQLFREGFRCVKCGVMITELLPETVQQPALSSELTRERRE